MVPTYTGGCLKALKIMDLYVGWISANPENLKKKYIYIYPWGGRFTGNSCPKGVYIYEVTTWLMLRK